MFGGPGSHSKPFVHTSIQVQIVLQVINAYMKLLMKSFNPSAGDAKKSKVKVHITSTFFYTKLRSSGYRGVEQWMKNVDMRRLWLLLVPVHLGCHWTLAAVNLRNKVPCRLVRRISHFVMG